VPITPAPAISVVKSADASGANGAGDSVAYSFVVTNTGNVGVSGVSITEDVFSGTPTPLASCPAGAILPGEFLTCTATYSLTQDDVDAGTVTNTAHADAVPASGGTVSSGPSSASISIAAGPALSFAKTASPAAVTAVGQTVTYTFRITNTGNVTLSNPAINDNAFSGVGSVSAITCSAGTVAPSASLDCTATYTILAADLGASTLQNSATADVDDPSGATITSATSSVSIPIALQPPPTGSAGGSGSDLPATGSDPTSLVLLGLGLLSAGAIFGGVGWLLRRRFRAARH
jgi:uncharacterized repeat protein (TIGR01451 family)